MWYKEIVLLFVGYFQDNVEDAYLECNAKGAQQITTGVGPPQRANYDHGDFHKARWSSFKQIRA
jgi:hypothetical protein